MFASLGRTFSLIKQSWRVLQQDRELIWLPLMSVAALVVVAGAFAGLGAATGSLDRMANSADTQENAFTVVDAVVGFGLLAVSYFIVMFFNAALISAAMERLRGGDPSVRSGLNAASSHIPAILGWALIAAGVGLILSVLESRFEAVGQFVVRLLGTGWAIATFFVIPVLIVEGVGPLTAIKQSGSLIKKTWGNQIAASFGFGIFYIIAIVVALIPAFLLAMVTPVLGILVGLPMLALAFGVVAALEGIFKAALYDFATGATPQGFDRTTLNEAYRAL
jgi:hypothetical protein